VLHLAGFTVRQFEPEDAHLLLDYGWNHLRGCSADSQRNRPQSSRLHRRHPVFERKIVKYKPTYLAFLGKPACSVFLSQRDLSLGLQPTTFGESAVWVLPNPSGLNRAFTIGKLTDAYRELFDEVALRGR
jgi:TDG/mug DNA glycosylase family protein